MPGRWIDSVQAKFFGREVGQNVFESPVNQRLFDDVARRAGNTYEGSKVMTSETDVVIVGAGSAGLSAATELAKRGLSYVVVEGSHRIGGRAYSEEIAPGVWFDLGCSFLHHGATNPFGPIADTLGVPLNRERADLFSHIRAYRNGVHLTDEEAARFEQYDDDCDEAIEASVARDTITTGKARDLAVAGSEHGPLRALN